MIHLDPRNSAPTMQNWDKHQTPHLPPETQPGARQITAGSRGDACKENRKPLIDRHEVPHPRLTQARRIKCSTYTNITEYDVKKCKEARNCVCCAKPQGRAVTCDHPADKRKPSLPATQNMSAKVSFIELNLTETAEQGGGD